jgi:biotin transport system substrate-specific component
MIASLLGPYLGALACMVYLFLGFVNLPVFAGFTYGIPVLLGPNGGFLFSFPIAAFVGGTILRTVATDRKREILHVAMGFVASLVVIYVIGTYWLLVLFPPYFGAFLPLLPVFVAVDCLKAIVGAPIIIRLRSTRIDLPVNRSLRLVKTAQANHVPSDP